LERRLAAYERRCVSDGDPGTVAIPSNPQDRLDRGRLASRELRRIDAPQVAQGN
jgi:hypothetical protein